MSDSEVAVSGRMANRPVRAPIEFPPRPRRLPLSYAQQRLWLLDQMNGTSLEYNMPYALHLAGPLNLTALERAIATIVARHEALRTRFGIEEGEPYQIVDAAGPFSLEIDDLESLSAADQQAYIHGAVSREWDEPFDLAAGPLWRIRVLRLRADAHVLIRTLHHIASDGWSNALFNRELAALYDGFLDGRGAAVVPPLPVQYADFSVWQRTWFENGGLDQSLAYWRRQLEGIDEQAALPADRPRPRTVDSAAGVCRTKASVDRRVLIAMGGSRRATLFMTLVSVFAAVLSRYSEADDVVIGIPIANRRDTRLEGLIGFFINTVVVRLRTRRTMTFDELLAHVRRVTLEAYRYQDLPFERLVEALSPSRRPNATPIVQVTFALHPALTPPALSHLTVHPVEDDDRRVRFDLEVHAFDDGTHVWLDWVYNQALYDPARVQEMAACYGRMLEAVAADPRLCLGELPLLTPAWRQALLHEWNRGVRPVGPRALDAQIEHRAGERPDAIAIVCGAEHLTYSALDGRIERGALALTSRGIGREDVVGVAVERSIDLIVVVLAVMRAGAAYLPLDPGYPAARLALMIADAQPRLVVITPASAELAGGPAVVEASELLAVPTHRDDTDARVRLLQRPHPENAAYVIYTSGSTGTPNGVVVPHRGLAALTASQVERFAIGPAARMLQFASLSFDAAVSEIATALASGAALVVLGEERRDPDAIRRTILAHGVTHAKMPPAVIDALGDTPLDSLEMLATAGEACPPHLIERWASRHRVINVYGPTEATVCTAMSDPLCVSEYPPPIGRPIRGVYVLDIDLEPVPPGVDGELYVHGDGLARGYLGRRGLTASRFIADPHGEPGARMYRTGDIARWRSDGQLEFRGRIDHQVKLRGLRIEPGEIETVLRRDSRVNEAIVLVRDNAHGRRLVAYVTLAKDAHDQWRAGTALTRALHAQLRESLPAHMVPAAVVLLERLPLTPNGKIDRQAFPDAAMTAAVAPRRRLLTPTELVVSQQFAMELGVEQVGLDDDFFALGGHSMMAARVAHRIAAILNAPVRVRDFFEAPTVRGLSQRCGPGPEAR